MNPISITYLHDILLNLLSKSQKIVCCQLFLINLSLFKGGCDKLEPSFAEVLRLGRPYPQVVGGDGWWVRGFRHRAPTLFLPIDELLPIEPAYIDTSIKIDEKANYYRNHFFAHEHINLVGYSRVWGPLVLSVKQDLEGYKLILRSVSGTETREAPEPREEDDWSIAVFGSLAQDTFSQVKIKKT